MRKKNPRPNRSCLKAAGKATLAILGDTAMNGENLLTPAVLAQLPSFKRPKVIYCAGCLLGRDRLQAERVTVRQTLYEIKVS
jgi:hypothetical protein